MAAYMPLSRLQETTRIGMTSKMRKEGMTPEQIAEKLQRPIEEVQRWYALCEEADKRRERMLG